MTLPRVLRGLLAILVAGMVGWPAVLPASAQPATSAHAPAGAQALAMSPQQIATRETRRGKPSRAVRAAAPARSRAYARSYIARRYHWGPGQFICLRAMWHRESGWRYWASNPNGRYHGIPQTSAAVWSRAGYTRSQYMNNPQVQIRVGAKYIKGRYHTPCQAWAFWRRHHWY